MLDHTKSPNTISFRRPLNEAVRSFLSKQQWNSLSGLPEVVTELSVMLAKYREEGKRLFPVVFLTENLDILLTELDGVDPIQIGHGAIEAETIRRAVKQCAPLGEGRTWVVYIVVRDRRLEFGVFRTTALAIMPTSLERLRQSVSGAGPILGVAQLSENVIELRASRDDFRYLHLSGTSNEDGLPTQTTRQFIAALIRDADPDIKVALGNLYYRVVIDVMQVWHGTLAVVIPKGSPVPEYLLDGVILATPVNIEEKLREHQRLSENASVVSADGIQSITHLIRGMMSSDGITLLGSDGSVLGYNVFLHQAEYPQTPLSNEGGARRRTHNSLCNYVGHGLVAAFYRSQDGISSCFSKL